MRMLAENAERELLGTFSSIVRDPSSWTNWHCLHIEARNMPANPHMPEIQLGISMLLEDLFREPGGTAFFCENGEIFVICKAIPADCLRETGLTIAELIGAKTGLSSSVSVYDLSDTNGCSSSTMVLSSIIYRLTSSSASQASRRMPDFFPQGDFYQSAPGATLDPERNKRVLLVEDDPVTRWLVRGTLKSECSLATAPDAGKALSVYRAFSPDIVLLDINLPDGSGLDVMHEMLKADPAIWIVMFSSQDTIGNMSHVINSGAKGFVAKPFSKERLMHYIRQCPVSR